ncbi:MAG: hypothetical protein HY321_14160 [Armatimonadetes bacterium]|nr:hypothetical protein [Armatimonadota bacterium]
MRALSGRERVMAAFSSEGTDQFPVVLPYLGIFLRDHRAQITSVPWWAERAGDIETRVQVARHFLEAVPIDWKEAGMSQPRAWRARHRVVREDGRVYLEESGSGRREELHPDPPGGKQAFPREVQVRTPDDIERLLPVTPASQMADEGALDHPRRALAAFGFECFVFATVNAPFWLAHNYLTFQGLMLATVEQQELLTRLLERLTERELEKVRALAMAGAHGVWIEDCYSGADLISPAQFRRFALPYVARVIAEIEGLGMRAVYYFCGDVTGRLEDLVSARPSALSLEESKKGFRIELAEVAEVVRGRCALLGNLDAIHLLERGGDEALRQAVAAQAEVGRRWPRFAFSLGSPVTALTPVSRVCRFIDLARERADAAAGR